VQDHHDVVFGSSSSGSDVIRGSSWFDDAIKPVSSFAASRTPRQKWGTARAYPPPVQASPAGRTLYEAHVDVSDQFTSFGKVSVGLLYFAFWIFLMFPNWFIPIGRPGIALGGGLLMIVYRYVLQAFEQGPAFDAENVIIMEPLYLLFGLMLTTVYLERMESGGLFDRLRQSLDDPIAWKRAAKILALSTVGSAAVMNDSIVLIFSGVVVDLNVRHKVANSMPYMLALATAANIGSAATMTGNPQNILISALSYDDIEWLEFLSNMILPVIVGTAINSTMLFVYYRAELFPGSTGLMEAFGIMVAGSKTPEMLAQERGFYARQAADPAGVTLSETISVWSWAQIMVVIGFLVGFAGGFDVSTVCISAGLVLMTLTAWKRQSFDPKPELGYEEMEKKKQVDTNGQEIEGEEEEMITESETNLTEVDYGLLLLFIGQFLLIGSFDDTGLPQAFFNVSMGSCVNDLTGGACVYWFVTIVTVLSNIASNVPICQMLAASFPMATRYEWLQVSLSATIAGNLTMLGSAANMIVAFQAAKVGDRTFTSERHAPFGIPSTVFCLYAGAAILTYIHFTPNCSVKLGECDEMGY
jgi:Na+/H+ antiporter NhaD/arsenite permease-like protein